MQNDKILVIALVLVLGGVSIGCSYVWTHQSEPEPTEWSWTDLNGCTAVLDSHGAMTITGPRGAVTQNYFSDSPPPWTGLYIRTVTSDVGIGACAFQGCSTLLTVTVNGDMISANAFRNCASLAIANCTKVTTYESMCFRDCPSLTSVSYDRTAQLDVDRTAFLECPQLTDYPRPPSEVLDTSGWN